MRGHHEKDQARHFTLSLSAQVHGSKGVGALYINHGAPFHALIKGGTRSATGARARKTPPE